MYLGFVNPTEAGGIGAVALFIIALAKRRIDLDSDFIACLLETGRDFGHGALSGGRRHVFSYFLALSTIPAAVSAWIAGAGGVQVHGPGHHRRASISSWAAFSMPCP